MNPPTPPLNVRIVAEILEPGIPIGDGLPRLLEFDLPLPRAWLPGLSVVCSINSEETPPAEYAGGTPWPHVELLGLAVEETDPVVMAQITAEGQETQILGVGTGLWRWSGTLADPTVAPTVERFSAPLPALLAGVQTLRLRARLLVREDAEAEPQWVYGPPSDPLVVDTLRAPVAV